jgi:anti-sigma regulatory factor (Ser/Thr protein kinase)
MSNHVSHPGRRSIPPQTHGPQEAAATLPVQAMSVTKARRLLDGWPDNTTSELARLVVSELVGNQVVHGSEDGELNVSVRPVRGTVRIEVDGPAGETVPTRLPHDARRLSGRGLAIVERACTSWGWDMDAGRTRVWGVVAP